MMQELLCAWLVILPVLLALESPVLAALLALLQECSKGPAAFAF